MKGIIHISTLTFIIQAPKPSPIVNQKKPVKAAKSSSDDSSDSDAAKTKPKLATPAQVQLSSDVRKRNINIFKERECCLKRIISISIFLCL